MGFIEIFGMEINDLVLSSFVLGAIIIIIGFIINRRKTAEIKNDEHKKDDNINSSTEVPEQNENSVAIKRGKNKKRREIQQEFTHPWMVGALKGHTGTVLDIKFSSDGKYLSSCAEDQTVHIWCTKDLASKNRKSLRINIDWDHATHVKFSPDGKAFIIHKSFGNNIVVYGLKKKPNGFFISATPVLEYQKKHDDDIIGMDIACNGRFIMTCGKSNDLIIWDLKGEVLAKIDTILGSTHRAKISPCGLWQVGFSKTGDFKQVDKAFTLAGHSSGVYDFDFSADSSTMATVSKDGTYRLYDTNVEYEKGQDPRFLVSGKWENSMPTKIALSPNAEILVISHGTNLSFYSTVNNKLDTTIEDIGVVNCLTFDATGEFLLAAVDKQIKIFRNIPAYRAAIESSKLKLKQKQSSATQERIEKIIIENTQFLKSMGEPLIR
ncbi:hypothetical protein HCN44_000192 [Aphidius gifuensis]|uniref:Transducin beta-like protein 2 n=1 Tax=Aphidius gifuensis TaxID=684658 RepID=A0A834XPL7_APHGI|nr:hypothetical protein HCN44_000192 [Aphidius gifuensis]